MGHWQINTDRHSIGIDWAVYFSGRLACFVGIVKLILIANAHQWLTKLCNKLYRCLR